MPFPPHLDNPLSQEDRNKLMSALKLAEKAKANCESMGNCGMDTADQMDRVHGVEELCGRLLTEYFGG